MDDTARARLRWLLGLAVVLLALALWWQLGSRHDALAPLALVATWRDIALALGWPAVLGSFVLACALAVPLSLLTLLAVLAFGPLWGGLLALAGASGAAAITFALGRHLGQAALSQWAGPRLSALNALAARRGVWAVVLVRLVPAAPFAVVNLMLGSTRIGWGALMLGNLLGMLPMVLVTAWAAPAILAQLQAPTAWGWGALAAVLAALALGTWALRRWARQA